MLRRGVGWRGPHPGARLTPPVVRLTTHRFTEPEEIAALVVFLAAGRVANTHGAEIVVDCGMLTSL